MIRTSLVGLFALGASLGGCTVAEDDGLGAAEGEKRVIVTDNDPLGRIELLAPSSWTPGGVGGVDERVSFANVEMELGAVTRIEEQRGCVKVSSHFETAPTTCNVEVQKGKTTTFKLSSIAVEFDQQKLQVDIGPKADALAITGKFVDERGGPTEMDLARKASWPAWSGNGAKVLTVPGEYTFSWGIDALGTFTRKVAAGQNAKMMLTPSDKRATLRVLPPATRDLPDAAPSTCDPSGERYVVLDRAASNDDGRYGVPIGELREGVAESRSFPGTSPIELKAFPLPGGDRHYEVVVNDVPVNVMLSSGKTKTLQMERLDVDHVQVTDENGKVSSVTGQYTVDWKTPTGAWRPVRSPWRVSYGSCVRDPIYVSNPTGTGMDLPPGEYRVSVHYSLSTGMKTEQRLVSLP